MRFAPVQVPRAKRRRRKLPTGNPQVCGRRLTSGAGRGTDRGDTPRLAYACRAIRFLRNHEDGVTAP